jgi:hypothetical protein
MDWLTSNLEGLFSLATTIVGVAAAVAALFPKAEAASGAIASIRKVIDLLALNFGNAKNAE